MRKLLVGDIHGNFKGLVMALEDAGYEKEYDQLICIGDYVDGWSESCEVIDFLIALEKQAVHKPIFIRGNHDVWCEDFLRGQVRRLWLDQGGTATRESYIRNTGHVDFDEHERFFRRLHNYYIDEEGRAFVHGGFTSRKGIGHEPYQSNYYWDRDFWSLMHMIKQGAKPIGANTKRYKKHKEIFIGHTSTVKYGKMKPMRIKNVWNVDTGGGYEGRLSIMDIDSKEYWQAPLSRDLYPGEMHHYKQKK